MAVSAGPQRARPSQLPGKGAFTQESPLPSEWKGFNNLLAQEMQYLSQGYLFIAYLI